MSDFELNVLVHFEDGAYWAEIKELPGCFASGRTLDELNEALREAIVLYLRDEGGPEVEPTVQIDGMKMLVSA